MHERPESTSLTALSLLLVSRPDPRVRPALIVAAAVSGLEPLHWHPYEPHLLRTRRVTLECRSPDPGVVAVPLSLSAAYQLQGLNLYSNQLTGTAPMHRRILSLSRVAHSLVYAQERCLAGSAT